jgi:UDP-N-acetylmuramoyl-tripeptide--D-alanyl-D-alanine ligase
VFKSEGNLNNHFGLPLMLLRLEPVHDIAVIEMGMSHPGEIRELARIAAPDLGVVTCVAPVHLEFFNSVLEIAKAKYELIEALPKTGTAVLNADDEHVANFGRDFGGRVLTFGIHNEARVRAERVQLRGAEGSQFDIITQERRQTVTLPLVGSHNIYNALAGAAVALDRGIDFSKMVSSMADLAPVDKRGEVIELAGATVINDCYNSNPKALEAMVEALLTIPAKRRIVVAGEMLELGPDGPELHRECGDRMAERKIDFLLGVRGAARYMVDAALHAGMRAEFVESPQEAGEWLAQNVRSGDAILLKASRGVRLEMALEGWRSRLSGRAGDIGGKALGRSR